MKAKRGFTLIELIVGMLVFSIAIVLLTSVLFPQSDRAAQTLQRVRAAELAQSVLNEIWGKAYDDETPIGGVPAACNPNDNNSLCSNHIGPDDEGRNDYDDVDDYDGMDESAPQLNSNRTYEDDYPGFHLKVSVTANDDNSAKLIQVIVTTPQNEKIAFDAVRSNY
ncbi:type II secretion system GspH family protein [Shewanella sp. C32]|uniref:Type II secretion system GspH family protein n=1 Tax=Shewanella electrica TaxID=515560 RepID=A0ABT2FI61_9GAMM|nr:type II secretion system protein [Shewanella electrica]MCH1924116.1 type II secretion system GspH family protein [Shewanella electrica]MCS4556019.1 type II secretion system GspH family protein [Shewanella electrica]